MADTTQTPTNWAPTAKVSAGVLAASVATLLLQLPFLKEAVKTPEAAAALTTLITFVVQYMVPDR